jgi:hypothetical protein
MNFIKLCLPFLGTLNPFSRLKLKITELEVFIEDSFQLFANFESQTVMLRCCAIKVTRNRLNQLHRDLFKYFIVIYEEVSHVAT